MRRVCIECIMSHYESLPVNKLLRFLETGEIQKLGMNTVIHSDVRIIAATSRNLEQFVASGKFRQDLLYRLNVVTIEMPSLRTIPEDIPLLFTHFVNHYSKEMKRAKPQIEPVIFEHLQAYSWPGNVRELRNIAERCLITGSEILSHSDLPDIIRSSSKMVATQTVTSEFEIKPLKSFRESAEKEYLENVLNHFKGNVSEAARHLQIDRVSLHNKIRNYGLEMGRTIKKPVT